MQTIARGMTHLAAAARAWRDGRVVSPVTRAGATYESRFGRVYNADNMSEMFDVHGKTLRWQHHDAVRALATAATQAAFDTALSTPRTDDDHVVIFTAGGNGSGKSTFLTEIPPGAFALDSTLANVEPSRRNIDRTLESGRSALVVFVFREPVDAFEHGVIPRLLDPANGRAVTIHTHVSTHTSAPETLRELAAIYAETPSVECRVVENRSGETPVLRDIAWLAAHASPTSASADLAAALQAHLTAAVRDGRLSELHASQLGGQP